jgi:hypothetical protein
MEEAFKNAEIVRKACIRAFDMTHYEFLELRGIVDNRYAREKYELMQKNFSRYFCELDYHHAAKFMEGL